MRVPLSWLRDYVEFDLSIDEVAELLTNAGLEVESITRIGLPGAELEWDRERIVLGRILRVEQHPDADRLVLATVDYGAAEPKTVVTGAPNLFPYIGRGDLSGEQLYSPLALEGATLYDGHKEGRVKARLKGRPLRGIYNDAMLCSEKELGISDEHEGIILITNYELRITNEERTHRSSFVARSSSFVARSSSSILCAVATLIGSPANLKISGSICSASVGDQPGSDPASWANAPVNRSAASARLSLSSRLMSGRATRIAPRSGRRRAAPVSYARA